MKAQHWFESSKRLAISTVLSFLASVLRRIEEWPQVLALSIDSSSPAALGSSRGAGAVGTGLIVFLADHLAWTGTKLLTLAVWVTAGLWLGLSLLGKGARDAGVSAYATGSHGLSWLGPRALSFGNALARFLSLGASRLAILTRDVGIKIGRGIERQIVTLSARWQPDSGRPTRGALMLTRAACNKLPLSACAPSTTGSRTASAPWTSNIPSAPWLADAATARNGLTCGGLGSMRGGCSKSRKVNCLIQPHEMRAASATPTAKGEGAGACPPASVGPRLLRGASVTGRPATLPTLNASSALSPALRRQVAIAHDGCS